MSGLAVFATAFGALYAAHHLGDYWTQRDCDARNKGERGWSGRRACLSHVGMYVAGQFVFLMLLCPLGMVYGWNLFVALTFSAAAHYAADRREHGLMFKLARLMSWNRDFLRFGQGERSLATGAWALDQSWHIVTSVFVPALMIGWMA